MMVRRRPKKLGQSRTTPRPLNRKDGKLKRWEKLSDIPLDEEDQFHNSRDEIFLEGVHAYGDEDIGDDEVFSLQGVSDARDDSEDGGVDEEEMEEERDAQKADHTTKKKSPSKPKATKPATRSSESSSEAESDSEEEETWGHKKSAYYASNAAEIESADEEANELEEQEAKRLQRKARAPMMDNDFGLDDPVPIEVDQGPADVLQEEAFPTPPIPKDKISLIRHLEKTSPETLALARDWEDTAWNLEKCRKTIDKLQADKADGLSLGLAHLQYQALLTYATTLAFYLHLRASEKFARRPELLHSHPVFSRLLTLKQSLGTLESLDFNPSDSNSEEEGESSMGHDELLTDVEHLWRTEKKIGLDPGELDELLKDATLSSPKAKRNVQFAVPPRKKRKTIKADEKENPTSLPILPVLPPLKIPPSRTHIESDLVDSFGEATSLQFADVADKTARKKSLRFHTSKIESVSMRRQGARNKAMSGDDDIPYKERRKEKEERLAKDAKKRGMDQAGADLDDVDPEPIQTQTPLDDDSDEGSGTEGAADGYYDLVERKAKAKKEQKMADYEASKSIDLILDSDEQDVSGPRSLSMAMLKNKGLTPHRPKAVRNPRVKKRKRFEKAKKKVASQKAVYKGGIGDVGKYGGERSGISKVVKSVRLA